MAVVVAALVSALTLDQRAAATSTSPCEHAAQVPRALGLRPAGVAIRCLVNRERAQRGLPPLKESAALRRAAQRHARDMRRGDFFAPRSPDGATLSSRVRQAGYLDGARSWRLGECLARNASERATPASVVRSWMRGGPARRAILTRRFRHIGIGLALAVSDRRAGDGPEALHVATLGARR